MFAEALEYKARFELGIRCDNCMRESSRVVDVPNVDDAPCDPEDLVDSAFLASLYYRCRHCDCQIGRLYRIKLL